MQEGTENTVKLVMNEEMQRKLAEHLPFDDNEHAEITLDCFLQFPEEARPYFFITPLKDKAYGDVKADILKNRDLSAEMILSVLLDGVLVGWKNLTTRSGKVIDFSPEAVKKLPTKWREALFWKAYNLMSPTAEERLGLG